MAYKTEVDFAPAYELVMSFETYTDKQTRKLSDLGQEWYRRVEAQLDKSLAKKLEKFKLKFCSSVLGVFIWQCPGDRSASGFLQWFGALSPGQLYEYSAPHLLDPAPELMTDLVAWRDEYVHLLAEWNDQYFRHIPADIMGGIQLDAEKKRSLSSTMEVSKYVETVTRGLVVEPAEMLDLVLLVPSYHLKPSVQHSKHKSMVMMHYSVDDAIADPEAETLPVLRLTRALADDSRLKILRYLAQGGMHRFIDVVNHTGLSKASVHQHLVALRTAGLVRVHVFFTSTERYSIRLDAFGELKSMMERYLKVQL